MLKDIIPIHIHPIKSEVLETVGFQKIINKLAHITRTPSLNKINKLVQKLLKGQCKSV